MLAPGYHYLINGQRLGDVLATHPPVMVMLDQEGQDRIHAMIDAVETPILRVYIKHQQGLTVEEWNAQCRIDRQMAADYALNAGKVLYEIGPNEEALTESFGRFERERLESLARMGIVAVVGNPAVGTTTTDNMAAFAAGLDLEKCVFGVHEYWYAAPHVWMNPGLMDDEIHNHNHNNPLPPIPHYTTDAHLLGRIFRFLPRRWALVHTEMGVDHVKQLGPETGWKDWEYKWNVPNPYSYYGQQLHWATRLLQTWANKLNIEWMGGAIYGVGNNGKAGYPYDINHQVLDWLLENPMQTLEPQEIPEDLEGTFTIPEDLRYLTPTDKALGIIGRQAGLYVKAFMTEQLANLDIPEDIAQMIGRQAADLSLLEMFDVIDVEGKPNLGYPIEVTAGPLNVRSGPGLQHATIGKLKKGTQERGYDERGIWIRIDSYTDSPRWIASKHPDPNISDTYIIRR